MTKQEAIRILDELENECVHSKNILAKLKNNFGEQNAFESELEMNRFIDEYIIFRENILRNLPEETNNIDAITSELNRYKNFVKSESHFSSQSKYESTILEEFIYYLFKDVVNNQKIKYGSVNAYCNLFFCPRDLQSFINDPSIQINTEDQDFSIFRRLKVDIDNKEYSIDVPIIAIECKTYLDKTMLEGSISTAEKIKSGNPHAKYFILTETYEVDYNVDITFSRIDQIYVLRKQKRRNQLLNPIYSDVILKLYKEIKSYLSGNWSDIESNIIQNGIVR